MSPTVEPTHYKSMSGGELTARYSAPYKQYCQQSVADLAEWQLAMQVLIDERAYYKEMKEQAQKAFSQAQEDARAQVHATYWWTWLRWIPGVSSWAEDRIDVLALPIVMDAYYAALAATHNPVDILVEWTRPPAYPKANPTISPWPAMVRLMSQAQQEPERVFMVPIDLIAEIESAIASTA